MMYEEARNSGLPFNRRKYIDGWYLKEDRRNIDYSQIDLSQRFWKQEDLEADDWWTISIYNSENGITDKD